MKGVVICEKLRSGDNNRDESKIPEWGNPTTYGSYPACRRRTRGTETSKYPEEKKSTEIPLVAASERGPALKQLLN